MLVEKTELDGVLLLEPSVFEDDRGFFMETWNSGKFNEAVGMLVDFVQDNHSSSRRGVLRGLHYQIDPHAQGKLVRCGAGAIWDVAVDIRRSSATFGCWVGYELTAANRRQLWIPPGFAHGFLALRDDTDVLYKVNAYYASDAERTIRWDDRSLSIDWPLSVDPVVSEKDAAGLSFSDAEAFA